MEKLYLKEFERKLVVAYSEIQFLLLIGCTEENQTIIDS